MVSSMNKIAEKALKECFKLKKSEKVLVVYDKKRKKIAESFFLSAKKIVGVKNAIILKIEEGKISGEEPSLEVAKEMLKYDVVLLVTTKSLSHTNARKNASKKGARIASMPGITEKMIRALDVDYDKIRKLSRKIADILMKGRELRITTKKGTGFYCKINHNTVKEDNGIFWNKGDFHNLPSGETFFAPIEGKSFGRYVVDKSQAGVGKLKGVINVKVEKGYAVEINGKGEDDKLNKILKEVNDKNAYNIAEVGIGTNYKAKISGDILEDEKVMGTCHIALGNNYSFGGKINVPVHLDGVIDKPTIIVDDKIIMKDGKFLI